MDCDIATLLVLPVELLDSELGSSPEIDEEFLMLVRLRRLFLIVVITDGFLLLLLEFPFPEFPLFPLLLSDVERGLKKKEKKIEKISFKVDKREIEEKTKKGNRIPEVVKKRARIIARTLAMF